MNLKEQCQSEGIAFTTAPTEAIYILEDGTMIDGVFNEGERSEDHRIMELISSFNRYDGNRFWLDLFIGKDLVMLVPETKTILIVKQQILTPKQVEIMGTLIQNFSYNIELFQ